MALRELAAGAIVTVIIGGGAYTINQTDVVNNLATDTGMSQQEAEQYVNGVKDEDLVPYDELGQSYVDDGKSILSEASHIDCDNYQYDWESPTLSCTQGMTQLTDMGNSEVSLGNAYLTLAGDSAATSDIADTVALLDRVNAAYSTELAGKIMDAATIKETKQTNSYNKATLQAALKTN